MVQNLTRQVFGGGCPQLCGALSGRKAGELSLGAAVSRLLGLSADCQFSEHSLGPEASLTAQGAEKTK